MGEAPGEEHFLLRRPGDDGPAERSLLPDPVPHHRDLRPLLRFRVSQPLLPSSLSLSLDEFVLKLWFIAPESVHKSDSSQCTCSPNSSWLETLSCNNCNFRAATTDRLICKLMDRKLLCWSFRQFWRYAVKIFWFQFHRCECFFPYHKQMCLGVGLKVDITKHLSGFRCLDVFQHFMRCFQPNHQTTARITVAVPPYCMVLFI